MLYKLVSKSDHITNYIIKLYHILYNKIYALHIVIIPSKCPSFHKEIKKVNVLPLFICTFYVM